MGKGSARRPGENYVANWEATFGRKDAPEQALQELADSSQELGAYDAIVFADEEPAPMAEIICAKITAALDGIDRENDAPYGWWGTSLGARFGAKKLASVLEIIRTSLKP